MSCPVLHAKDACFLAMPKARIRLQMITFAVASQMANCMVPLWRTPFLLRRSCDLLAEAVGCLVQDFVTTHARGYGTTGLRCGNPICTT